MTSEAEIGYIAGLLEGEGSFSIKGRSSPYISFCMTDEDTVIKACNIMNVRLSKIGKRIDKRPNTKPTYYIAIYGRDAMKWMRMIRPYMSIRRGIKIDEVINIVIKYKPYIELGSDYCATYGHSIKYDWEWYFDNNGVKKCKRCVRSPIKPPIESGGLPFINPFNGEIIKCLKLI